MMYNMAFTFCKYINKKNPIESLNIAEKRVAKLARGKPKDMWGYIMDRVDADNKNKKDYTAVKSRLSDMLA